MDGELLTTSVMARAAGCSEATVRRAASVGAISARRDAIGRRIYGSADLAKLKEYVGRRAPAFTPKGA